MKYKLARMFTQVHESVADVATHFWDELRRKVYTTPKSYLDAILMYLRQLDLKKEESNLNIQRLSNGCLKLRDTNTQIAELKISLAALIPRLEEENVKAAAKAVEIEANKKIASAKEATVEEESAFV